MRAQPQAVFAFPLEVETFIGADDQRQPLEPAARDPQLDHGAALGLKAQRRHPGGPRDRVAPGSRRIDQDSRFERAAILQTDRPFTAQAPGVHEPRVSQDRRPISPRRAQIIAVEAGDVDVGQARFPCSMGPLRAQARQPCHEGETVERFGCYPRDQGYLLVRARDVNGPARGEIATRLEQWPAGAGQRRDQRSAIAFVPEGGRATRGMISRLGLALDQDHAGMSAERRRQAGPGDSAADDQDVAPLHLWARLGWGPGARPASDQRHLTKKPDRREVRQTLS